MYSLYSSAQAGIFGAIVRKTNVEKILQLNCTVTDFYQNESFPTYLYYNPYDAVQSVCYSLTDTASVDLYDILTHEFIAKNVEEESCFQIPATSARLLVVLPAGSKIEMKDGNSMVGTKVVAYRQQELKMD